VRIGAENVVIIFITASTTTLKCSHFKEIHLKTLKYMRNALIRIDTVHTCLQKDKIIKTCSKA